MAKTKDINATFTTVYHELKLQKDAKEKLAKLAQEIETLFRAEGIQGKIEKEHHMTLSFQKHLTADQLSKSLILIDGIRKSLENFELLNPHKKFDQSLHQIQARESFDDGQVYIVLTPHNGESIYKDMILSEEISPHITLAKVPC
ncbi:MAG: hypothetical protein LBO09_02945 [Candidatus Peribacteria bacterium]|jgi:hypothetical protein|nr:hypothetical protein [Candidatus Peribacteria bacterium]